jgi:hypothetical protein
VAREELGAAAIGMGGDPLEHVAEIGPRIEPHEASPIAALAP